jgi:hypothetical protein
MWQQTHLLKNNIFTHMHIVHTLSLKRSIELQKDLKKGAKFFVTSPEDLEDAEWDRRRRQLVVEVLHPDGRARELPVQLLPFVDFLQNASETNDQNLSRDFPQNFQGKNCKKTFFRGNFPIKGKNFRAIFFGIFRGKNLA